MKIYQKNSLTPKMIQ